MIISSFVASDDRKEGDVDAGPAGIPHSLHEDMWNIYVRICVSSHARDEDMIHSCVICVDSKDSSMSCVYEWLTYAF